MANILYRHSPCPSPTAGRLGSLLRVKWDPWNGTPMHWLCSGCGLSWVEGNIIRGEFSATRACDPRCLDAVGPDCVCSCGGANHASAWAVVEGVTQGVLAL